jgi:hypothetical protein
MAHRGQERALGVAGRFRRVLGFFQLRGADADLPLELVPVMGQGGAPVFDLRQHGVEAVDQRAKLVVALVGHAQAVILAV